MNELEGLLLKYLDIVVAFTNEYFYSLRERKTFKSKFLKNNIIRKMFLLSIRFWA